LLHQVPHRIHRKRTQRLSLAVLRAMKRGPLRAVGGISRFDSWALRRQASDGRCCFEAAGMLAIRDFMTTAKKGGFKSL
jgi:hypothetical protein